MLTVPMLISVVSEPAFSGCDNTKTMEDNTETDVHGVLRPLAKNTQAKTRGSGAKARH